MSFHLGCRDYAVGFMAAAVGGVVLLPYDFASRRHGNNDLHLHVRLKLTSVLFVKLYDYFYPILIIQVKHTMQSWREERKRESDEAKAVLSLLVLIIELEQCTAEMKQEP